MERASRVMYSIANVLNYIIVAACTIVIVCSVLALVGIIPTDNPQLEFLGVGSIIYAAIILVGAILTILLVRIAKNRRSSKGWDILFIVLGVISHNVFYILGGIFGVLAVRR